MTRVNRLLVTACVLCSLTLHALDQSSDAFASFLFFAEGDIFASAATATLIALPGLFVFLCELRRTCCGKSNILKALAYLIFTPLWTIVIHLYSLFDPRYVRTAFFFKALQGFLEAAPQLVLQLSLLLRGRWTDSDKFAMENMMMGDDNTTLVSPVGELEILGRVYDKDSRQLFGVCHLVSVVLSFFSIYLTAVSFNDLESNSNIGCEEESIVFTRQLAAKLCVSVPFFFFTLVYRATGLALLICFAKFWGGIVIFGLFFINVLSALYIGDDFRRSLCYGLWSLLVPSGFNRDPESPLGYSKLPLPPEQPVTERDIERSQGRARYFLSAHVLTNLFVLGPCLLSTIVFAQTSSFGRSNFAFDSEYLNTVFLPLLGLSLGFSMVLARPYHRCECSGGEGPKGNAIV